MNRRQFLKTTALVAAALVVAPEMALEATPSEVSVGPWLEGDFALSEAAIFVWSGARWVPWGEITRGSGFISLDWQPGRPPGRWVGMFAEGPA